MQFDQFHQLESRRLLSLTPIGGATNVPESADASATDVAAADNGMYLIATETFRGAPAPGGVETGELEIVSYSAAGEQFGAVQRIDLTFATNASPFPPRVRASMDADGDAIVTYLTAAGSNAFGALEAVRISKTGVMGTPFDVLPAVSGAGGYFLPAISLDDSGGFFLAWSGADPANVDASAILVQAFDAANVPRDDAFVFRMIGISESYDNIEVAAYPDGSGAIVATGTLGGEGPTVVEFARVSTSGIVGARMNPANTSSTSFPSIALYPDKSFLIGYERQSGPLGEPPAVYQVFAQRYNASGVAQGSEIEIGSTLAGSGLQKHTYGLDVAATSDGGFVASFAQLVDKTDTWYAEHYDAAGTRDGGPVVLDAALRTFDTVPPTEQGPQTFIASGGDVAIATWQNPPQNVIKFERLATNLDILLDRGALTIFGTGGDDTISVALQGADIVATRGSLTKTFAATDVQFISINGFAGNDTISNDTALPSTLSGGEGDDTVYGGDGPDRIRGETGRDSLWGRDGNDSIFGDDGPDSCYGNGGRDRIDGGPNSDFIRGNAGRDKLFGGHGNDRIYGSESADWLYGGIGNDQLFGEGGNDQLYGEGGADTLSGSAGDDFLSGAGDGVIDQLFGDRGSDSAWRDPNDLVTGIEALLVPGTFE